MPASHRRVGHDSIVLVCTALLFCTSGAYAQWQSVGGGVNHLVHAFLVDEETDELIVSGSFIQTNADSLLLRGLGKWNGQEWSTLAGGSGDTINGSMNAVYAMAEHLDTLFVAHHSIIWHYDPELLGVTYLTDDEQWHACGSPSGTFWLFEENERLFGGGPDSVQGEFMPGVLEWVGGEWRTPLGSPFTTGVELYGSAHWHGQYYFGGVFLVDGSRKIVAYDGVDQWTGLGGGVGGIHINTIEGYGDSLYVGGFFTPGADVQSKHIQIWDGAQWKPFFPEVEFSGQVWDIREYEGELYIIGPFKFIDDDTEYGILRFDGHSLCAIGGPFTGAGSPISIGFYQGSLFAGLGPQFQPLPNEWVGELPLSGLIPDRCVSVTTGLVERMANTGLHITPNPASDELTIEFGALQAERLEILDATGRTLEGFRSSGQPRMTIRVGHLATGAYTLKAVAETGVRSAHFVRY